MAHSMDLLLQSLNQPSRHLIVIYVLIFFNDLPISFNHLAMAFYGSKSAFTCLTMNRHFNNSFNESGVVKDQCLQLNSSDSCEEGWVYSLLPREHTIISEWDLVCDRAFLASFSATIYFLGVMFGGVIAGFLADYFGRKPVMLSTLYLSVPVGVGIVFMPTYIGFVSLRFVQGALMQGLQSTSYALLMEISLTKHRAYLTSVFEIFWSLGLMLVALCAYTIGNWRYIQLAISLPALLTIPYIWLMPESPRWLLIKGRVKAAESFFRRISNSKGTKFDPQLMAALVKDIEDRNKEKKYTVFDLCRTGKLRRRSLLLFFIWFVTSAGYYGLTLSITDMAGNKYLNFFIATAIELPAYTSGIYILTRFGRKRPLIIYFVLAGIMCIIAGVIPTKNNEKLRIVSLTFALFGKFNMAGAFNVIFLYATEIYPTCMRNVGLGMCAVWLRIGGVLAPQLILLSTYTVSWLPIVLFGSLSIVAGIATSFLPETLNTKLPDTVEHCERIKRDDQHLTANQNAENLELMDST